MNFISRVGLLALITVAQPLSAEVPGALLDQFDSYPHAVRVNHDTKSVTDHEIGLGAMRKVRGVWGFKSSERQSGELTRYTWQIIDGFTANGVLAKMEAALEAEALLFSCDGRSCGDGAQWANRVFGERLLYGVYGEDDEVASYRLVLFSSARTADRQHLHVELLAITP